MNKELKALFAIGVLVLFAVSSVTAQRANNDLSDLKRGSITLCEIRNAQIDHLIDERRRLIEAELQNRTPGITAVSAARIAVWKDTMEWFQSQRLDDEDCKKYLAQALRGEAKE